MNINESLWARRESALPRGLATAMAVFCARAENAELWDADGRRYIDFAGGIGVLNVGHRHPRVMAAVKEQLDRVTHTAFQVVGYDAYVCLAERLNERAPIDGTAKTLLLSTGAEAVENAVKIARVATGRSAVISFNGAFHGRTFMSMALTGKTAPYKRGFGPMPTGVFHATFPTAHQGITVDESLRSLQRVFEADVAAADVAAIIIEPVQGEGGFNPAPAEFLHELRALADQHGIVLIADEVQSGFARTGKLFAIEHAGVSPDLIIMAKSLAGGFPLSAVVGRAELMDAVDPGGLGGTYAGSPIACAAALAVLDVIDDEHLLARATELGERVTAALNGFSSRDDLRPIGNIRGIGAMLAFDLLVARGSERVDPAATAVVIKRAQASGLIILSCGAQAEAVRLLFPLTIQVDVLDEGLRVLEHALQA